MRTPRQQTAKSTPAERERPADETGIAPEIPIFDGLSAEDRASIERGLARSRAGLYASDAEVEAAFALFDP